MRFSVVIITFNDRAKLLECLHALQAQSFPGDRFEIIVVDDGSTDGTADSVRSQFPRVRLVQKENSGPDNSRTLGVSLAIGEFVVFIDSDCLVAPDWLDNIDRSLERNKVSIVGGPIRHSGNFWVRLIGISDFGEFQAATPNEACSIPSCNLAIRRELLADCPFHPWVRMGGDVLVCYELRRRGHKILYDPTAVVVHRPRGDWQSFVRRARVYGEGFVLLRLIDPTLRHSWILKGGLLGVILGTVGRAAMDWYRLFRFWKPAGFHLFELPPAAFLILLKRVISVPPAVGAYRNRARIR